MVITPSLLAGTVLFTLVVLVVPFLVVLVCLVVILVLLVVCTLLLIVCVCWYGVVGGVDSSLVVVFVLVGYGGLV